MHNNKSGQTPSRLLVAEYLKTTTDSDPSGSMFINALMAAALLGAGQTILLICLPVFVENTGIGYDFFAGIIALGTLLFVVAAPVWGSIGDRLGYQWVIAAGLSGLVISHGLFIAVIERSMSGALQQTEACGLLILSRLVYGVTVSGLHPAIQAWVIHSTKKDDELKSLGRITAAINSGRLLGPVIPFVLLPISLFLPMVLLILMAIVVLLLFMNGDFSSLQSNHQSGPANSRQDVSHTIKNLWPTLMMALLVTVLFGLLQYLVAPVLQFRFDHTATDASRYLALIMMAAAFSTMTAHLTLTRLLNKSIKGALFLGSSVLLAGGLMTVLSTSPLVLIAGIILCAASVALLTPGYTRLATSAMQEKKGMATGLISSMHTMGYSTGALLAGLLYPMHLALVAALIVMVSFFILIISSFLIPWK